MTMHCWGNWTPGKWAIAITGLSLSTGACVPLSTTTTASPPVVREQRSEVIESGKQPRFHARLQGATLTLDGHRALTCQTRRTQLSSSVHETTVESSPGMVAAEVTLAAIGLGIAGVNLATGAYDAPLSQGDEDDSGQESDIIIRVGIPATFGAVFAFAAAVDIAAADHRKETVRTGRRLPDTFAPCTNKILHGVTVEIRNGDKSIASRFDENARAYFDVPPALAEQLEKDAFVDVVIHGTSLARVYVDR